MSGYRSTRALVDDLISHNQCIVVEEPFSPELELAEIQRRVYASGGPAVLFTNPCDTAFPMVCNLFGTLDRARFIFRHTIQSVRRAIELRIDSSQLWQHPWRYKSVPWVGLRMRPRAIRYAAVTASQIKLSQLPMLKSWPEDGGPFVTLPQVLSQSPSSHGLNGLNLGMYRVQLAGNRYEPDREVGLHYQIHRGIGVHHQEAIASRKNLPVCITVGGSPAMTLAAVMPLPEGMSELGFAGALAGHRIPLIANEFTPPLYADADFAIVGHIDYTRTLPEGPFGDHLGYYSNQHDFPVMKVDRVYHRDGAVWPFTVVGRPPQEDTTFGALIHELTGPIIPTVISGIREVNAVDAAGVHPLLLALGTERYMPFRKPDRPAELITQACAILGQGQLSLAKYLLIANYFDDETLNVNDIESYLRHLLSRIDWCRDLHFITRTTIDTLDYSGDDLNKGSKVIWAASGSSRRSLCTELASDLQLPASVTAAKLCFPGVLAIQFVKTETSAAEFLAILGSFKGQLDSQFPSRKSMWEQIPLVVVVDDVNFVAKSLDNFLWVTFTRSNPAADIHGVNEFTHEKHWGCNGPLIIDARIKSHHAPPLIESPEVTAKIDAYAAMGGPLAKYL
jgi:4-hydroxy-3-polyprenylbenzoate decarboxylase